MGKDFPNNLVPSLSDPKRFHKFIQDFFFFTAIIFAVSLFTCYVVLSCDNEGTPMKT